MSATLIEYPHRSRAQYSLVRASVGALLARLAAWRRRARARQELISADPRMLADLGISRAEAEFRALEDPLA